MISVVIPVYNGAATVTATLRSASQQTCRDIEIIVVDDGSTDSTVDVVARAADADPRIRLFSKSNSGVADARNFGIAEARGAFLAPLDADDLWHPRKLEQQLKRFEGARSDLGLVYNWYRRIDKFDNVLGEGATPVVEGWVLHQHLDWNFISNGSTPLIRRDVFDRVRYDNRLHAAGNQGCEDYLLQLEIARHYRFACVPAFLTGYRKLDGAMSSNSARMIRSHLQMYAIIENELGPDASAIMRSRVAELWVEYARNRAHRGKLFEGVEALNRAVRINTATAVRHAAAQVSLLARRLGSKTIPRTEDKNATSIAFSELDALAGASSWRPRRTIEKLERLALLDDRRE